MAEVKWVSVSSLLSEIHQLKLAALRRLGTYLWTKFSLAVS